MGACNLVAGCITIGEAKCRRGVRVVVRMCVPVNRAVRVAGNCAGDELGITAMDGTPFSCYHSTWMNEVGGSHVPMSQNSFRTDEMPVAVANERKEMKVTGMTAEGSPDTGNGSGQENIIIIDVEYIIGPCQRQCPVTGRVSPILVRAVSKWNMTAGQSGGRPDCSAGLVPVITDKQHLVTGDQVLLGNTAEHSDQFRPPDSGQQETESGIGHSPRIPG